MEQLFCDYLLQNACLLERLAWQCGFLLGVRGAIVVQVPPSTCYAYMEDPQMDLSKLNLRPIWAPETAFIEAHTIPELDNMLQTYDMDNESVT